MTPIGWILMVLSWSVILGILIYAFVRIRHIDLHASGEADDSPPEA